MCAFVGCNSTISCHKCILHCIDFNSMSFCGILYRNNGFLCELIDWFGLKCIVTLCLPWLGGFQDHGGGRLFWLARCFGSRAAASADYCSRLLLWFWNPGCPPAVADCNVFGPNWSVDVYMQQSDQIMFLSPGDVVNGIRPLDQ